MRALVVAALLLGACGGGTDFTLAGRWVGQVVIGAWEGTELVQHFDDAGAYRMTVNSTDFVGTWSVAGDMVTIADGSCVTTDPGTFQLNWVDEATFIYHTVDDACESRGDSLNGMTMTQPFQ